METNGFPDEAGGGKLSQPLRTVRRIGDRRQHRVQFGVDVGVDVELESEDGHGRRDVRLGSRSRAAGPAGRARRSGRTGGAVSRSRHGESVGRQASDIASPIIWKPRTLADIESGITNTGIDGNRLASTSR